MSSYFIPIARPKQKRQQLQFDTEWTQDRIEENKVVNRIRQRVSLWREGGYIGVTLKIVLPRRRALLNTKGPRPQVIAFPFGHRARWRLMTASPVLGLAGCQALIEQLTCTVTSQTSTIDQLPREL